MSINPVTAINADSAAQFADPSLHRNRPSPPLEGNPTPPDSGTASRPEAPAAQPAAASAQLPEDEVQVLRDSQTNGEIVIKYLDRSGDVILQVPSSQVLGVTRAIDQDFKEEAKVRASSAGAQDQGGKGDGR